MNFDHYTIRLIQHGDAEALFELFDSNRKRLEDFFAGTISKTKTFEDTKSYTQEVVKKIADKVYYPFLVIDNAAQTIAGFVDVKNIDWNIPKAELGCFIDVRYAENGISAKAMNIVCSHFFNHFGFDKLFLRTHPNNNAARRLAEKSGFSVEGIIRHDYKTTSGEIVDLIYYGRLKEE